MSGWGAALISSGDPEEDAREAERVNRHLSNTAEGLCPNGCAPLEWPEHENEAVCPVCGFIGVQMSGRGDFTKPKPVGGEPEER